MLISCSGTVRTQQGSRSHYCSDTHTHTHKHTHSHSHTHTPLLLTFSMRHTYTHTHTHTHTDTHTHTHTHTHHYCSHSAHEEAQECSQEVPLVSLSLPLPL